MTAASSAASSVDVSGGWAARPASSWSCAARLASMAAFSALVAVRTVELAVVWPARAVVSASSALARSDFEAWTAMREA